MPAARPDEAPPREVAGKAETDKGERRGGEAGANAMPSPRLPSRATKKRR